MSIIYHYLPWITGLSITALILLYIFAPTLLKGFVDLTVTFATPLAKWLGEQLVAFLNVLKEGAADMLDNWKSMIFVATIAAIAGWTFHTSTHKCFEKVRKDWKLTPRHTVTKVVKPDDPVSIFMRNFGFK